MDKIKDIFEFYKEAVIAVKDNEIIWCNSSADTIFPKGEIKEKIKYFALFAIDGKTCETVSAATNIDDKQLDMIISYVDDILIISILPPEKDQLAELRKMLGQAEDLARNAMTLFSMTSSKLRPVIDKMDNTMLSTYAEIQSHSHYSLAYVINNISKLTMSGDELSDNKKSYFDIVRTCEQMAESVNKMIKYRGLEIKVKSDSKSIIFFGSEEMIYLGLMKMLSNSTKYVKDGGNIEVSLSVNKKYLTLVVSDDGPGIPKSQMLGIFDSYKVQDRLDDPKAGLGLGLYVVKQVASMHGGSVFIESKKNQGTKVTMMFPIRERKELLLRSQEVSYYPSKYEILAEFSDSLNYKSYTQENIKSI